jgi:hypothetical protein
MMSDGSDGLHWDLPIYTQRIAGLQSNFDSWDCECTLFFRWVFEPLSHKPIVDNFENPYEELEKNEAVQ